VGKSLTAKFTKMEYFYIFKHIDFNIILKIVLQFLFFCVLIIYCKIFYYASLVLFEKMERGRIKNKFLFFIISSLFTTLHLLIVPLAALFLNSFEEINFTVVKYAFASSFIITMYCFIKTFSYNYIEDDGTPSLLSSMVNENKKKLNKKPNG